MLDFVLAAVANGRVAKTPTPKSKQNGIKLEAMETSFVDAPSDFDDGLGGFGHVVGNFDDDLNSDYLTYNHRHSTPSYVHPPTTRCTSSTTPWRPNIKINSQDVANKWTATFPNESFHPTKKAIEEHVARLKRDMKNAGSGSTGLSGNGNASSTPKSAVKRTPASKRSSVFKTPASGRKRAAISMSDGDDDEEGISTPVPKRQMTSRRSKSATRKYADPQSSEEDATKGEDSDDDLDAAFASVKAAENEASASHDPKPRGDSVVSTHRSASKFKRVSLDEQSDVSEFDPSA
ncbi:hypothetical protein BST61_g6182 [Cercospora zeina]